MLCIYSTTVFAELDIRVILILLPLGSLGACNNTTAQMLEDQDFSSWQMRVIVTHASEPLNFCLISVPCFDPRGLYSSRSELFERSLRGMPHTELILFIMDEV